MWFVECRSVTRSGCGTYGRTSDKAFGAIERGEEDEDEEEGARKGGKKMRELVLVNGLLRRNMENVRQCKRRERKEKKIRLMAGRSEAYGGSSRFLLSFEDAGNRS